MKTVFLRSARKGAIDVMPRMRDIILNDEVECCSVRSDHADVPHIVGRNTFDEVREHDVEAIREADEELPLETASEPVRHPTKLAVE